MLRVFVLLFLLFAAVKPVQAFDPSCVHGLHNVNEIKQLGVKSVRWIITDDEMYEAFSNPKSKPAQSFKLLQKLKQSNVNVILTLRFPANSGRSLNDRVQQDRVPSGQDREQTLKLVEKFVLKAGPYLSAVQLNNEPLGGPGYYIDSDITPLGSGKSASILWLEDLGNTLKRMRQSHKSLSHIKLVGPGLTAIGEYLWGKKFPELRVQYLYQLIDFTNKNMDLLDVHLHSRSVDQVRDVLGFVKKHAQKPIVTLEWSQAKAMKEWLYEPISLQTGRDVKTNKDFLLSTYKEKVSPALWHKFLSSAPFEENFIRDSYNLIKKAGFKAICYSPANQYGDPYFDIANLFVPRSVESSGKSLPRNSFIYDEFALVVK